jgi:hypothetical protein
MIFDNFSMKPREFYQIFWWFSGVLLFSVYSSLGERGRGDEEREERREDLNLENR